MRCYLRQQSLLWRLFALGIVATFSLQLVLHCKIDSSSEARGVSLIRYHFPDNKLSGANTNNNAKGSNLYYKDLTNEIKHVEREVLTFFHGEKRALDNGAVSYSSKGIFRRRLADKMRRCGTSSNNRDIGQHDNKQTEGNDDDDMCTLRIVFVGSAQVSGRDNLFNWTFPFVIERRLRSLCMSANLRLEVLNHAMDNDLSREGPQTSHMCMENLVGGNSVDVIGWGFGDMAGKAAQFESFIRWASRLHPALILVNRDGGPHGLSRRGKERILLDISPGHHAVVYEDDAEGPLPRQEPYLNSSTWKRHWQPDGRNAKNGFWLTLFEHYSHIVDFGAIDPAGSIWHLDHLAEFSNAAFDRDKALPLFDCGYPGHEPPCDGIPEFVRKQLVAGNMSFEDLPRDTDGLVCGVKFGCRHFWYGGSRSHSLRGELNAIVITRAFHDAVELLLSSAHEVNVEISPELPPPIHCLPSFCDRVPACITSYEPNLGLKLSDHLVSGVSPQSDETTAPQLSIAHHWGDPKLALKDIESRFVPLGYIDRKFGYRLSVAENDSPVVAISFESRGSPLVLCEPPCFVDECPPKRKMPLIDYVTLELDGTGLPDIKNRQPSIEVGHFCALVAEKVSVGKHLLRLMTNTTGPNFVMFSHLISF